MRQLVALLLMVSAMKVAAQEPFFHKDWALSCDNIGTCYAEGYQEESALSPISMLITRPAGANTAVDIKVQLQASYEQGADEDPGLAWTFKLGSVMMKTTVNRSSLTWHLTPQQVQKVLPQLLNHASATVHDGKHEWVLSLAGAKAVLLKMDDYQGRMGTPSALVKRGKLAQNRVLKPLPMPVIHAVVPPLSLALSKDQEATLISAIIPSIKHEDYLEQCNDVKNAAPSAKDFTLHPLTKDKLLLGYACSVGAYNYSGVFWTVSNQPPYAPTVLNVTGDYFNPADATITEVMKGRGVGDCIYQQSWVYDGQQFVLASSTSDAMCRGFAGGAWTMPSYVSKVVRSATVKSSTDKK